MVFWQWVNQSFNALVNYTNRNANSPLTTTQMGVAYVSATTAAMSTALVFKFVIQKRTTNPILAVSSRVNYYRQALTTVLLIVLTNPNSPLLNYVAFFTYEKVSYEYNRPRELTADVMLAVTYL